MLFLKSNKPTAEDLCQFFRIMQRDFTKKTNEILHLDKMVVIFPEVPSF